MDAFDQIELDAPEVKPKFQRNNGKGDAFDLMPSSDDDEPLWKSSLRTATQVPLGLAEGTITGLAAEGLQFLGLGEAFDPEEIDRIKEISEREAIPFDEEKYKEAAQNALQYFPTVSNIAREIEKKTGIPLEPKDWFQNALRLGSLGYKAFPGNISQKVIAGVGAPAVSETLQAAGVPEQFADILGLAASGAGASITPEVSLTKQKPSGLPARQYEKLTSPAEVSQGKLNKINKKVESDFQEVSNKIIKESPVGETAENLKNDPTFKQESQELLEKTQEKANSLQGSIPDSIVKKEISDIASKEFKGFGADEYDRNYAKFTNENIKNIRSKQITPGQMVEMYRKNNSSLKEYFEPGSSRALNRAKRDAILDYNRAIANLIRRIDPELAKIFDESNARWTKIRDVETIDDFVNGIFTPEGIKHKKMHEFFDDKQYERIFKRALGEKGYKDFEQLMLDMSSSENAYKMLQVAKSKGFEDLFKTGLGYVIHPKLGIAKAGWDSFKYTYKGLLNAMLDKPQLGFKLNKAVKELKKGDFAAAEKDFNELQSEISASEKSRVDTLRKFNEKIKEKPEESVKNSKNVTEKRPSNDSKK